MSTPTSTLSTRVSDLHINNGVIWQIGGTHTDFEDPGDEIFLEQSFQVDIFSSSRFKVNKEWHFCQMSEFCSNLSASKFPNSLSMFIMIMISIPPNNYKPVYLLPLAGNILLLSILRTDCCPSLGVWLCLAGGPHKKTE